MTAKLPPKWVPINFMQLNEIQLRHVQAYAETFALQAVRDALEQAAKMIEQGWVEQRNAGISDAIRALLKEYSDE